MMVTIVPCERQYWEFVRLLRTDRRTVGGFIQQGDISADQHRRYMERYWESYLIGLIGDEPVGYAGSIDGDLRVCVHPDHQDQGIGKILVYAAMEHWPGSQAKVKWANEPSRALFESCGFRPTFVVYQRP